MTLFPAESVDGLASESVRSAGGVADFRPFVGVWELLGSDEVLPARCSSPLGLLPVAVTLTLSGPQSPPSLLEPSESSTWELWAGQAPVLMARSYLSDPNQMDPTGEWGYQEGTQVIGRARGGGLGPASSLILGDRGSLPQGSPLSWWATSRTCGRGAPWRLCCPS